MKEYFPHHGIYGQEGNSTTSAKEIYCTILDQPSFSLKGYGEDGSLAIATSGGSGLYRPFHQGSGWDTMWKLHASVLVVVGFNNLVLQNKINKQ